MHVTHKIQRVFVPAHIDRPAVGQNRKCTELTRRIDDEMIFQHFNFSAGQPYLTDDFTGTGFRFEADWKGELIYQVPGQAIGGLLVLIVGKETIAGDAYQFVIFSNFQIEHQGVIGIDKWPIDWIFARVVNIQVLFINRGIKSPHGSLDGDQDIVVRHPAAPATPDKHR